MQPFEYNLQNMDSDSLPNDVITFKIKKKTNIKIDNHFTIVKHILSL